VGRRRRSAEGRALARHLRPDPPGLEARLRGVRRPRRGQHRSPCACAMRVTRCDQAR
jgi:hypothetical protein